MSENYNDNKSADRKLYARKLVEAILFTYNDEDLFYSDMAEVLADMQRERVQELKKKLAYTE